MFDFIKNLFMDDKGMKWGSIIGTVAGGLLLPSVLPFLGGMGIFGNVIGAVAGLLGGNLISGLISGGGDSTEAPATPAARPAPSGGADLPRAPMTPRNPNLAVGAAR